jgi:peptidoglycan/xylan/chitin deacetylase (PgdA/CDA1 family)
MFAEVTDHEFALCLTHDVDRPYKTYQSIYDVVRERSVDHLTTALSGANPYWQFDAVASLERELGVRSAFYMLNEPHLLSRHPRTWLRPVNWIEHLGRYDVGSADVADAIRSLHEGGWEIGLHGSRHAARDRERLAVEKRTLERVLGAPIAGGRQHHLELSTPETWQHYRAIGLRYDTSLGSSTEYGFEHGYHPQFPLDDVFAVFPLTVMEIALSSPDSSFDTAWAECESLLREAAENGAVMTALWHPRYFNTHEFPGYRRLYRRLVERALEMDAWVGPPGEFYERWIADDERRIRR